MKRKFTLLFMFLAMAFASVNAQFTFNGLYTIECVGTTKFMTAPKSVGDILTMSEEVGDNTKFYIVQNAVSPTKYNIITTDELFLAASDGAKGVLIENTEANRNSDTSGALVDMLDLGANPYRIESYPDGVQKGWNGQRGTNTQVGMGSTTSTKYQWNLTRVGDYPGGSTVDSVFTVNIDAVNGTVTKTPDAKTYKKDSTVVLTATPNEGFEFISWTGDVDTTSVNPITITVTDNMTITANFDMIGGGRYTNDGLYTIECVGSGKYMTAPDTIGDVIKMTAAVSDYTKFYVVENKATAGKYNIITTNELYLASSDGSKGVLIENTEANRNSATSGALVDLLDEGANPYRIESYPGSVQNAWNGQRTKVDGLGTQVGMGTSVSTQYQWNFIRIGDLPGGPATDTLYAVNVTAENGTVSKTPGAEEYKKDSTVVLTATPNQGFEFVSWSGDVESTENPITVTVTSDMNITANFEASVVTYGLTIAAENGSVTKTPEAEVYEKDSTVTLTATSNEGFEFVSWSGDVESTENPITVTVTSDMNITANFEASVVTYGLTIAAENGSVTKTPDAEVYEKDSTVTLTATANEGFEFVSWSGDVDSTATNPLTITITKDMNITANFKVVAGDKYTTDGLYSLECVGTGMFMTSPDAIGDIITMGAPEADKTQFYIVENTVTPGKYNIITKNEMFLAASDGAKAILILNTQVNRNSDTSGALVDLIDLGANPYRIESYPDGVQKGWNGQRGSNTQVGMGSTTSSKYEWNLKRVGDMPVDDMLYPVNVIAENGVVAMSPDADEYQKDSSVELTATPNEGYEFDSWSGDVVATENPVTVTVTSLMNITANFVALPATYNLIVTAENGSVSKTPDQEKYDENTSVVLSATPSEGYEFVSWSGDAEGTENPLTVTITKDMNITANFAAIPATYSLTITAENGSVSKNPEEDTYVENSTVELTAVPDTGFEFVSWSGDVNATENPLTVTVTKDMNITANFTAIPSNYSLTITAENGSVIKNPEQDEYVENSTVELTAVPNEGYEFVSWSGDVDGTENPLTVTVTMDMNITANFEIKTAVENIQHGVISLSPNPNIGTFTIRMDNEKETSYSIYSLVGKKVQTGRFISETMVYLDERLNGIYIVEITNNNQVSRHKIAVAQ